MSDIVAVVVGVGHIVGLFITVNFLAQCKYPSRVIGLFIIGAGLLTTVNVGLAMLSVGVVLLFASGREFVHAIHEYRLLKKDE